MLEIYCKDLSWQHSPTLLIDNQNNIIAFNSILENLIGILPRKHTGKNFLKYFVLNKNKNEQNFVTDISQLVENHVYCAAYIGDENVTLNITIAKNKTDENDITWLTIFIDNNERAECEAIKGRLSRLKQAIESAEIGIWELNLNTNSAYFSSKFKELINVNLTAEFTWSKFRNMIFTDDLSVFDTFFQASLNQKIPFHIEFRMAIADEIRWFEIKGEVIKESGKPSHVMGSLTDSTNNKRNLKELNNAIHSKNMAMEAGKIGAWHAELNNDNVFVWRWDKLHNEMFALGAEDSGNIQKWKERLHPDDTSKVLEIVENSLKLGQFYEQNFRAIMPDGVVRYFMAKGKVSLNHLGNVSSVDGICIDTTAIHEADLRLKQLNSELEARVNARTEELERSTERAEQANKSKSDFLSMMSHELRTPMNGVIGSLDLLTKLTQTDDSMDLIDTARTSAESLVSILNDILDINKIEAGKLDIEDRAFSVSEIINNVVKVFIPVAKKNNIVFNVYEDPDIPMFVSGDGLRVRQILFNLIGNAMKFTPSTEEKKGIVLLHAEVKESNEYVSTIVIRIEDNGIGINSKTQQKLFTPFTQAKRSTTRKYGGTGLGLAICMQLAEMMGGLMFLESEEDKGSSFSVEIPFWLSRESVALDVESLSAIKIAFVDVCGLSKQRLDALSKYLVIEGAEVTTVASKLDFDYSNDFDVMVMFVGDLSNHLKKTQTLIKQFSNTNNILLAIDDGNLEKSRRIFPDLKGIKIQSSTRIQFVEAIQNFREKSTELMLDDWNLDEIELEEPKKAEKNNEAKVQSTSLLEGVLLVEDNPLNQKLIVMQLNSLGYDCDLACDGVEGMKKWQENHYKLILSDCHMPNVDGYQMTELIRNIEKSEKRSTVPIIAVTGAAMRGDAELCFNAGMNDFVSKPVTVLDLKEMLKKWYPHE